MPKTILMENLKKINLLKNLDEVRKIILNAILNKECVRIWNEFSSLVIRTNGGTLCIR